MQLPLIPPTRSKSTRPAGKASVLVALALCAALAPPQAEAKSRRARVSASSPSAKIQALQARRRKAIATFNNAVDIVNQRAVFLVHGKIQSGNTSRLLVYGQTYGQNRAAASALGQNNDETFLTIHNPNPQRIMHGLYQGHCIALSQTDFAPAPAAYFQAVATLDKYREIIASLESEIKFQKQAGQQAIQKRERAKLAKVQQAQTAGRSSVYLARAALAKKEADAKLVQLNGVVAGASDKGSAYLQSSAAAMALFNKWGNLGVANRPLLERTFDDLANAAAWQLERGNWSGALQSAGKLLSLELFDAAPQDAQTGRTRTELGVDADDLQKPSRAVGFVMHRNGKEPAAASKLAQVWLAKLPAYIAGPATREEKLRVAEISQLLGSEVFALDAGRTRTIALAVDTVRGSYGPGALAVLPRFVLTVEAAKRERVARQIEAFSNPREVGAPTANTPQANAPTRLSRTAQGVEDATTQGAPEAPPQIPAKTPADAPADPPTQKPVEKPLVPAVDFLMRSLRTGKKMRLSDFKGKTVILYFWDALWMENHAVSPTPAEKLFAFSKRYDPQKVVFLLVGERNNLSEAAEDYRKITDPTPDAGRDQRRGHGPRLYPEEAYSLETGVPIAAGDTPPERVIAEAALTFYTGSKNVSRNAMRVTVISSAGQVVGSVDFERDQAATLFNEQQLRLESYRVYDFDEAALEDLLVRAMAPQP